RTAGGDRVRAVRARRGTVHVQTRSQRRVRRGSGPHVRLLRDLERREATRGEGDVACGSSRLVARGDLRLRWSRAARLLVATVTLAGRRRAPGPRQAVARRARARLAVAQLTRARQAVVRQARVCRALTRLALLLLALLV